MSAPPAEARGRALARAALAGNPSDAYGGRTLAITLGELAAEVVATRAGGSDRVAVLGGPADLVEAAATRFEAHLAASGRAAVGCSLEARTAIPREVGLGGSSAIVIATLRALCALNEVELTPTEIAELALAAETEELGIAAGPQDRFAQAHEGLLYMDFGLREPVCERLDPDLLPALFLAYGSAPVRSGDVHAELRRRFERGEEDVVETLSEIAALAERARRRLLEGDHEGLRSVLDANFDARARIMPLEPTHARLVEIARSLGAAANYAGSGGAIVGIPPPDGLEPLRSAFAREGCAVIVPTVA